MADGFGGPLPVRNYAPIQQLFLNLPFERAVTQAPGTFRLSIESVESNVISTEQGYVEALLKFEQNRTTIGGAYGIMPGWDVGLDVPLISRYGGFLDPVIDSVEDLFGSFNVERKRFPNNSYGGLHVSRNGQPLFQGHKQYLELGDIFAGTKYELWHSEGGGRVALRGAIKAPTGRASAVIGSGKWDFGLGLAAEMPVTEWLGIYGNVGLVYPTGPITAGRLSLNPIVTEGFALEALLFWGVSAVLQQEFYTSPIHGTGTPVLDGNVVELAAGLNWRCDQWLVQLGGVDNVSGVAPAADFSLLARLTWTMPTP